MKNISKKLLVCLFVVFFLIFGGIYYSKSNAAYTSYDINSIDESRYPGFKSALQNLKNQYPNWTFKLYYTGLDWNSVLNNEYTGHGGSPKSLIYDTYKGEWICPICGEKKYDVSHRWYCASKEAIAYMMDPRNSFTADYMFQFQELASTVSDRSAIEKMVQGSFLMPYVDAILEASQTYNVSPYHIVSRIKQEQGSSGIGSMNGYIYTTPTGEKVKVYNLFNINVSGNNTEEGLLAGARFAYEQGWTTPEKSIIGGTKFIREKYIDKGQSTLYFQKYNVVNQSDLYGNQYMQNIRAANDEGNVIYYDYKNIGVVSNSFEFTIPIYENMPSSPAPRPLNDTTTYRGDIASELINISMEANDEGRHYIKGEIYITEWINGSTWSVPRTTPKMRLKTESGTYVKDLWVSNIESNKYYFDGYIEELDPNQKYVIEIESGSSQNTSQYRIAKVSYNKTVELGKFRRSAVYIEDSKLVFKPTNYKGDIGVNVNEISINKNASGQTYMKGELAITEWIDSVWTIPDVEPTIKLKAKDGTQSYTCWVVPRDSNNYYFDIYLEGLHIEKDFVLEVELQNKYNQSKYQKINANAQKEMKLGEYSEEYAYVWLKNDTISFELIPYRGDIAGDITSLSLKDTTIQGNVNITEWIDGSTWSVPRMLPKMRVEDTTGKLLTTLTVSKIQNNEYHFVGDIKNADTSKSYVIKIEAGSPANTSKYKICNANYAENKELGKFKDTTVKINNGIISFVSNKYRGDISSEITSLSLNGNTIQGNINITEWIDGVTWSVPTQLPKMRIKNTTGKLLTTLTVSNVQSNSYRFTGNISGIDVSKAYVIEIESGSAYNTSKYKIANAVSSNQIQLGQYNNNKVTWTGKQLQFTAIAYRGDLANEIKYLKTETKNGKTYLTGEIIVTEWLDGVTWSVPSQLPIIRAKSNTGKQIQATVVNESSNYYKFEIDLSKFNTTESYTLEVESGNKNNTSKYKKASGKYSKNEIIGTYNSKQIKIENNTIRFK